jgi:hypothetical protein
MSLTDQELRALNEWQKLNYRKCLVCSGAAFSAEAIVVMEQMKDGVKLANQHLGAFPLVCRACGFTIFVQCTHVNSEHQPKGHGKQDA